MTPWLDTSSNRRVYVLHAQGSSDWPATPSWDGECFALFVATDRDLDIGSISARALEQGLAAVAAWGAGCEDVETAFDEAIVGDGSKVETIEDVILTTSHAEESLREALEFFLDAFVPRPAMRNDAVRGWSSRSAASHRTSRSCLWNAARSEARDVAVPVDDHRRSATTLMRWRERVPRGLAVARRAGAWGDPARAG